MELTSHITFLYFRDLRSARLFFEKILSLKSVFDPGWAVVYSLGQDSFIGAVDLSQGSIPASCRDGVLISFTVKNLETVHAKFSRLGLQVSSIKAVKDLPLKSFFFEGPEGYRFEVQQFTSPELRKIF